MTTKSATNKYIFKLVMDFIVYNLVSDLKPLVKMKLSWCY